MTCRSGDVLCIPFKTVVFGNGDQFQKSRHDREGSGESNVRYDTWVI